MYARSSNIIVYTLIVKTMQEWYTKYIKSRIYNTLILRKCVKIKITYEINNINAGISYLVEK